MNTNGPLMKQPRGGGNVPWPQIIYDAVRRVVTITTNASEIFQLWIFPGLVSLSIKQSFVTLLSFQNFVNEVVRVLSIILAATFCCVEYFRRYNVYAWIYWFIFTSHFKYWNHMRIDFHGRKNYLQVVLDIWTLALYHAWCGHIMLSKYSWSKNHRL